MRSKLKEIRTLRGYTQQDIATSIGIDRSSYTNIELGVKNPSLQVALNIKKALSYDDDDIFLIPSVPIRNFLATQRFVMEQITKQAERRM